MSSKRTFNILHFIVSRKSWLILVIGNSLHTNPRRLQWSQNIWQFDIDVRDRRCFDWNHCYHCIL